MVIALEWHDLVLKEIHYHPLSQDTISGKEYEFLELQNRGDSDLDLSGLTFTNGLDFTYPSSTFLSTGAFIVIASNNERFTERYGFSAFGEFEGQLDNSGERLVLLDSNEDTVFNVRYNDKEPWPVLPDSLGYSLTWTNAIGNGDYNDPENWTSSTAVHGSPGIEDIPTSFKEMDGKIKNFELFQNYPNPFNPETVISYQLPLNSKVSLKIYDVLGREIKTLINQYQYAGQHSLTFNAQDLSSGIYIYKLHAGNYTSQKKMLLIK